MERTINITWIILLALTGISVILSQFVKDYIAAIILGLAIFKIIGVALNFMELKKAHLFWQVLIIGFTLLICVILLLL
ncbi:cytochrome C oxidase subunit IV family protein [Altibacter sp.]|uniref:cytochrome C oxidase subunit IV family protein n=1 Tax=Altibacter sp. TaxID=2024823 RepID=UPI0025BC866D|nr:cytochrome C oxidase subunit IV family protein [Altibacter sp.]